MVRVNYGNIFRLSVIIVFIAGIYLAGRDAVKSKVKDYETIIRTEQEKAKTWRDNANYWHSKAETAELRNTESLQYLAKVDQRFAAISKEFEGVKKNLSNVQYVGFTGTQSSYQVTTHTRDTIFLINSDTARAMYFSYHDSTGWFNASGIILENGAIPLLRLNSRDSLVTVITRKKKLFKRPVYSQEIKSYNPHTRINYNASVMVNRRRKFLGVF